MEDASLDDFVGDQPGAAPGDMGADGSADPSGEGVEPADSTYQWSPDAACEGCGASVERRWRDGDAMVCTDCKEW